MSAPLILIVGSADPARTDYEPALANTDKAAAAAQQLGAELARRGCRIVVYSASPSYLEADVVRGFVGAVDKKAEAMIEVRYPHTEPSSANFAEAQRRPKLFVPVADRNASWEAAFYSSLRDASGVLIIGGGRSAHAIGYMALAYEIPIMALACFGGAAKAVWLAIRPGTDLPTQQNQQLMNPATWNDGLAPGVVGALLEQSETRRNREKAKESAVRGRSAIQRIAASVALLLATIALTAWGLTLSEPRSDYLFVSLLFLVGPLAGAGSALALAVWRADENQAPLVTVAGLGFVAGLFSSLVYLLAQFTTASDAKSIKGLAVLVAMATGLLAGFAVDRVFTQATEGRMRGLPGTTDPPSRGRQRDRGP